MKGCPLRCIGCGDCVKVCATKALVLYGKEVSVDEIYDQVKRDKVFYEISGGGVTISGGEPLFQSDFTANFVRNQNFLNKKYHTQTGMVFWRSVCFTH